MGAEVCRGSSPALPASTHSFDRSAELRLAAVGSAQARVSNGTATQFDRDVATTFAQTKDPLGALQVASTRQRVAEGNEIPGDKDFLEAYDRGFTVRIAHQYTAAKALQQAGRETDKSKAFLLSLPDSCGGVSLRP